MSSFLDCPSSMEMRHFGSGALHSGHLRYMRGRYHRSPAEFEEYDDMPINALMELVQQIVAFHMKHNAEPEAVDLLMEVEDLDLLVEHVDKTNYKRTCLYLISSSRYFIYTAKDLDEWYQNPESFHLEQDMIQWTEKLRPCAEALYILCCLRIIDMFLHL